MTRHYLNNMFPPIALFGLVVLLMVLPITLAAEPLDDRSVRVGMLFEKQIVTMRVQAAEGDWQITLTPKPQQFTRSKKKVDLSPEIIWLDNGEDITLQITAKGILGRLSGEKELDRGYSKIEFSEGALLSVEIPDQPVFVISGKLEITTDSYDLIVTNELPMGEYLTSAVSDLTRVSEIEAIKAYLIMARTRTAYLLDHKVHASASIDVCDTTHCFHFPGKADDREIVSILREQTANQVMRHKGKLFFCHFQNCCGGQISSGQDIFGVPDPVHKAMEDRVAGKGSENCFHDPSFLWRREFSKEEIRSFLSIAFAAGADNVYLRWAPVALDSTGRITKVLLSGSTTKNLTGTEFLNGAYSYFGENGIKSTRLTTQPMQRGFIYRGMGQGFGVGMCLRGADGLAKKGYNAQRILQFYYSDISFSTGN